MYPLKSKPGPLISITVIVLIWLGSFAFALPMGMVHHFEYAPGDVYEDLNGTEWSKPPKPFCRIRFDNNTLITGHGFKYYRYV